MLKTKRLTLRKWTETDAGSLYEYAKDPAVGPIAGWPPHKSKEESLDVIRNVLNGAECYAICEKGSDKAIGAIELMLHGHSSHTERDNECELGYWLGKPSGDKATCRRRQENCSATVLRSSECRRSGADILTAIKNQNGCRKSSAFSITTPAKMCRCRC